MKRRVLSFFILILSLLFLISCDNEPKHTHTFNAWEVVVEASCTREGLMERECTECGYGEEHTVQRLMHELERQTVEPTCDTQGYSLYTCQCGYSNISDYVKPLGHKLKGTATSATCTSQGYTHYECSECDYKFDGDFVMPLAHSGSRVERVYATVSGSGYTLYSCGDCGHIYKEDFVSYSDIVSGAEVENTTVLKKGIDTSKNNHKTGDTSEELLPIDWVALKAEGVEFVILKAGSSKGKDPAFEADYAAARAAGLEVGAYFYAYSTTVSDTVKDATTLLQWLEGKKFEYPIYFDVEDSSLMGIGKKQVTDICLAFAEVLQSNGYYAAIYANNDWLYSMLDTQKIKALFDVWYARYPIDTDSEEQRVELGSEEFTWNEEKYGKQMGMWQYTSKGIIGEFECRFDFNYCYKDYPSIMREWGLNGF